VTDGGTHFDLCFGGKRVKDLKINLVGRHFALNASFASVAALLLGAGEQEIRDGLALYSPEGIRSRIEKKGDITLISDCYNAAPESMRAAIDTLASLDIKGKRIAVLGDMRELGDDSDRLHAELGGYLADKVDVLITLGESGRMIAESAIGTGMISNVSSFVDIDNIEPAVEKIRVVLTDGDAILFKASRSLRFERLISEIFTE
jgi:UDP-N-acetylmuramoyl-tripeptide--D-alanyl-D-alanine ligase